MNLPQLKGKVYPDMSFSIGVVPRERKKTEDRQYDRDWSEQWDSYTTWYKSRGELVTEEVSWLDGRVRSGRFNKSSKSSQKRGTYGQQGISRFGKKMVKNGAILLERKYGIKRLGFVTCTLPNYSRKSIHILARSWSEITRRFFQKVKRHQRKMGCPEEIISSTEIQPKRYRKYGIVAPHLHFVYICKNRSHEKKFLIAASLFRRMWQESVSQVLMLHNSSCSEKPDFNASVDCQVVKKSVAAYLGKYISKGGEIIAKIHEDGMQAFLPKQWWTADKTMKKMINDAIIVLDSATCKDLFYRLADYLEDGILTWCNYISVEINGEDRTVGCVGVFSEEHYYLLTET